MIAPRDMAPAEQASEINRLVLIIRDARRKADDLISLAACAEWDRDMVDPAELRNRVTALQIVLDRVHAERREQAA